MYKGGKLWVKPGWATQKLSQYEKQRMHIIEENQARMNDLGLHQAANSFRCSIEKINQTSSSKKGKRNMGYRRENEEYNPLEDEDGLSSSSENVGNDAIDGDNESSESRIQKVVQMPPKRQSTRIRPPSTPVYPPTEGAQSQQTVPQLELVSSAPITPANNVASTVSSRKVRGLTRGQRTERLVSRLGKLPVEIPDDCNVPVGPNASSLNSELGKEIRGVAPLKDVRTWTDIDISLRGAIIQRALEKFNIKDYATNPKVQGSIDNKCQSRYRNWKCALHLKYEEMLQKGVDPKSNLPRGVKAEDWNYMIDHIWTDEKWKARSKKNKKARSHLLYNHTCGSRSFPATMSMMATMNNGKKPHIVDFYKESHWSKSKNDWLHPTCKEKHDEFLKVLDRCSQPDATPMSQEEMSIEVLGSRPGYLRGFGVGPKPSSASTTAQYRAHEEEVRSLREVVESQNQKIKDLEAFQVFMKKALQHVGFTPPGDFSSDGNEEGTSS